jgi:hypothetical protein
MREYENVRNQRMAEMFKTVSIRDGVTEDEVRESLTNRPEGLDLLVILSFAALYMGSAPNRPVDRSRGSVLAGGDRSQTREARASVNERRLRSWELRLAQVL